MSVRSLNKVTLIGNLTRDPELRYTPAGTAVCSFGVATNRQWTTQTGETKEDTEFHRIVAWNKLGELCAQLLSKGRKVYVEGRLSTRSWTAQDGTQRTTTEIVIDDMIILDSKKQFQASESARAKQDNAAVSDGENIPEVVEEEEVQTKDDKKQDKSSTSKKSKKSKEDTKEEGAGQGNDSDDKKNKEEKDQDQTLTADDIPF